jgi:uncharacterized protein (DUF488 family)
MQEIHLFTIGFAHKNAQEFFETLKKAGVKRVIDIRLNNTSQLAGFTKKDDLQYFLKAICNIDYTHELMFAPTKEIFDEYKIKGDWETLTSRFNALIRERKIEKLFSESELDHSCLLCSESSADKCHRRLVAEYLQSNWGNIRIIHL